MSSHLDPTRITVAAELLARALDLPPAARIVGARLRPAITGVDLEIDVACPDWPAGRCDAVLHRPAPAWDLVPTEATTPLPPEDPFNGLHALGSCWCGERHHNEEGAA